MVISIEIYRRSLQEQPHFYAPWEKTSLGSRIVGERRPDRDPDKDPPPCARRAA